MSEHDVPIRVVSLLSIVSLAAIVFFTQRLDSKAQETTKVTDERSSWERLDAKSVAAQTDDEAKIRELAHGVFEPFSWSHEPAIQGGIEERISRAEVAYRARLQAPIPEENVVRTVNNLAEKLGTPEFTKTDIRQVRYLRLSLMIGAPHLVGATSTAQADGSMPRLMSPVEAAYVTMSLIHQKLYNHKYQVSSKQWVQDRNREDWQQWHDFRVGKSSEYQAAPKLVSVPTNYNGEEVRKIILRSAAARNASGAASGLANKALDDLGVSR